MKVFPPMRMSAGDETNQMICAGNGVSIGGIPAGGTPPFTYQWDPSSGLSENNIATPVARPVETTMYSVIITDSNGCQARGQLTCNGKPEP